MTTQHIIDTEDRYQIPTYSKLPIALSHGEGSYVWDTEGRQYLDFYGGHCVTLLGHCPPRVVKALQEQAADLLFYSNVVYSPLRAAAAEALAGMMPSELSHVFFCNSGTEANETALKMARTYTGKNGIIAMQGGFHGRTLGSLSATGIDKYRAPYVAVMPHTYFTEFGDIDAVSRLLDTHRDVAAVILEPIQSMAGITEASDAYFQSLRQLCDDHGVLLIFDEVQTGVGRTGTFSIAPQYGIIPDIVTMAKSLASGIPVGATMTTDVIAAEVKSGDHGSTFGGGMLAMAALNATLETLKEDDLLPRAGHIFDKISDGVKPMVTSIRGRGCLMGLELESPVGPTIAALRHRGVLVGSSSDPNVMRLMPPINSSDASVDEFNYAFHKAVSENVPA